MDDGENALDNDGLVEHFRVSITNLFFPGPAQRRIKLFVEGGDVQVVSLEVSTLESIWQEREYALGVLDECTPKLGHV